MDIDALIDGDFQKPSVLSAGNSGCTLGGEGAWHLARLGSGLSDGGAGVVAGFFGGPRPDFSAGAQAWSSGNGLSRRRVS